MLFWGLIRAKIKILKSLLSIKIVKLFLLELVRTNSISIKDQGSTAIRIWSWSLNPFILREENLKWWVFHIRNTPSLSEKAEELSAGSDHSPHSPLRSVVDFKERGRAQRIMMLLKAFSPADFLSYFWPLPWGLLSLNSCPVQTTGLLCSLCPTQNLCSVHFSCFWYFLFLYFLLKYHYTLSKRKLQVAKSLTREMLKECSMWWTQHLLHRRLALDLPVQSRMIFPVWRLRARSEKRVSLPAQSRNEWTLCASIYLCIGWL